MKKYIVLGLLAVGIVSCTAKKAVVAPVATTVAENTLPTIPLTAELAAGKTIYEAKCGKCHDLPNNNNYSKERWKPIMVSMQKKAKISDDERELVYSYVTMNL
jgi:cytochrome c5